MRTILAIAILSISFASGVRAEHPMEAIARTLGWCDKLTSYEVELTIHQTKKSIVTGKLAEVVPPENRNDGTFSEWVQKLREFKLNDGRFAVVSTYGGTSIVTARGEVRHQEVVTNRAAIGDRNNASVSDWEDGKMKMGDLICGGKDSPCDAIAREFEWSRIPLYYSPSLFQLGHRNARVFEKTIERIGDAHPDDVDLENARISKKAVRIYRVKIGDGSSDVESRRVMKITVSDEGFDKGLVRQIEHMYLKKEKEDEKYTSEKQVVENVGGSVNIEWKLMGKSDQQMIVPVSWKIEDKKEIYSHTIVNITAKWRLEEPDPKSLTSDLLEKLNIELQREVDRALGRQSEIKKKDRK